MTFTGHLFETAFLHGGLDPTSKNARNDAWRNFDPTASGTPTNNAWKIDMGAFKTDPERNFWGRAGTLLSRFTWEAPQSLLGNTLSHARNRAGKVDNVEYWGGATLVNDNSNSGSQWGLTLGSYINSENMRVGSDIFRHEYGHVLQSKLVGPLYFGHIGVPSFAGSIIENFGWHSHSDEWYEIQANRMSSRYLEKHRSNDLDSSKGGSPWDTSGEYKREYIRDWYFFLFPPTYPFWLNF
jgi:hypothetical protein